MHKLMMISTQLEWNKREPDPEAKNNNDDQQKLIVVQWNMLAVEALQNAEKSEHVPIYEDKDGDWMLVGDVPWE